MRFYLLLAAATITIICVLVGVAARGDESPGVVTRWEYKHVQIGWSKTHVQRFYGTRGDYVVAWYGGRGHLHVEKRYPTADGSWTMAVYRDSLPTVDGTQQGVMKLRRKER